MHIIRSLRITVYLVLSCLIVGGFAHGQTEQDCPDNAADLMLQVYYEVLQTDDETRLTNAYNYARGLPDLCAEDPVVHYFASFTFIAIADRVAHPQSKFDRLSEAIGTFMAYDALAEDAHKTYKSTLTDASGAPIEIDLWTNSHEFLSRTLALRVVYFEGNGLFHPWVSRQQRSETPMACPYKRRRFPSTEAYGHYLGHQETGPIILGNGGIPNLLGSVQRIEWLIEACPQEGPELKFELIRLRKLAVDFAEARDPGSNGWVNPTLEAVEAYLTAADGTDETETNRYYTAQKWQTELKAMVPEDAPGID